MTAKYGQDPVREREVTDIDDLIGLIRAAQTLGFMWHAVGNGGPEPDTLPLFVFSLDYYPDNYE